MAPYDLDGTKEKGCYIRIIETTYHDTCSSSTVTNTYWEDADIYYIESVLTKPIPPLSPKRIFLDWLEWFQSDYVSNKQYRSLSLDNRFNLRLKACRVATRRDMKNDYK